MNARTQITMDRETQRRAQAKAAELGIRRVYSRLVTSDLAPPKRKIDVSILFDLGASDKPTGLAGIFAQNCAKAA